MSDRSDTLRKRSLSRGIAVFAAAIAVIFVAKIGIDRFKPRPLQPLVDYTLAHGTDYPMPAEVAGMFSIPHDGEPLTFRQIKTGTPDGHTHAFAARIRPENGKVDILMNDIGPEGFGYYYRTSIDGRRIQAVHADTEMRPVMDGPQRFAKEIEKWLNYLESAGNDEPVH